MSEIHKKKGGLARHLGEVAREARTRAGLTQEEVAERVGVVTEVYGRLERGRMLPSLPTLVKLCRALGLDANPLLGFAISRPPTWLKPQTLSTDEPASVRRLMRTARRLRPHQLTALSTAARAMLPGPGERTSRTAKRAAKGAPH